MKAAHAHWWSAARVVDSCRFRALAPRVHVRWIRVGVAGPGVLQRPVLLAALTGPPGGGSTTPRRCPPPPPLRTAPRSGRSRVEHLGALAAPAEGVPAPPVIAGRGHRLRLVLLGQLRVGAEHALFSCPPRRVLHRQRVRSPRWFALAAHRASPSWTRARRCTAPSITRRASLHKAFFVPQRQSPRMRRERRSRTDVTLRGSSTAMAWASGPTR